MQIVYKGVQQDIQRIRSDGGATTTEVTILKQMCSIKDLQETLLLYSPFQEILNATAKVPSITLHFYISKSFNILLELYQET